MSTRQTPQRARLARAIVGRTMAGIMIFTAAFAVAFAAFDAIVKPGLSNFLYFEVMGGDGGASWRLYDALTTLYLPLAALLYAAGIFLFVRSGVNRALSYFDALYEAAEGILAKRAEAAPLPPELSETAAALGAIKEERERADRAAKAAEERKNELVAYLAHDIKTPLTSIINYVDLLQHEHTPEQEEEYLAVLKRQAFKLKKLTEDLVEASKATTGNLPVNAVRCSMNELLSQVEGEYGDKLSAADLTLVSVMPDKELFCNVDGALMWRVIDNLLSNICKYAQNGTRVYLTLEKTGGDAVVTFKNTSRAALNIPAEELMERFVRGDSSRSTEGNGLGLSIAQSLTELQGGKMALAIDGDLFKAILRFPTVV